MCFSRYTIPIIFKMLVVILFVCESHFKCLCMVNPRKLNWAANYILIFSISIFGTLTCEIWHLKYHGFGLFDVD